MVNHTSVLRSGEPPEPARPVPVSWKAAGSRLLVDRLTRRVVTLGGVLIIGSILAILVVIAAEVYPLFKQPKATRVRDTVPAGIGAPLALGVDEYREVAFLVTSQGIRFIDMKGGALPGTPPLPGVAGATITATSPLGRGAFAVGLSDGRAVPIEVRFSVSHQDGKRIITPDVVSSAPFTADPAGRPIRRIGFATTKAGPITVGAVGPQRSGIRHREGDQGPHRRVNQRRGEPASVPPGRGRNHGVGP